MGQLAKIEAQHPGFKAWCREQFVGNECDTDEYRETEPFKGLAYISEWAALVQDKAEPELWPMLAHVQSWLVALTGPGGSYASAEQLRPVLAIVFDELWLADLHPYDQEPEELLADFLDDQQQA